jgi:hypothetical protein
MLVLLARSEETSGSGRDGILVSDLLAHSLAKSDEVVDEPSPILVCVFIL